MKNTLLRSFISGSLLLTLLLSSCAPYDPYYSGYGGGGGWGGYGRPTRADGAVVYPYAASGDVCMSMRTRLVRDQVSDAETAQPGTSGLSLYPFPSDREAGG